MRIVTNEKIVASRAKLGRRASLIGMVILLAGLVISFNSSLFYVSLLCLIVGFIISNVGVHNANLWLKEPRADQAIERGLKGFSNKFTLLNYTGPVSHVIVGPPGIIVMLAKPQEGRIMTKGSRWRQPFTFRRLIGFFGAEALGNPTRDLKAEMGTVQKFVSKVLPETEVPMYGAIVFYAPTAELQVEDVEVPVLTSGQLKDYMRSLPKEEVLSPEQQQMLKSALQGDYEPPARSES